MREKTSLKYLLSNINPLQFYAAFLLFALTVILNYFMHWDLFSLGYADAAKGGAALLCSSVFLSLAFASHSKMQHSFYPLMFFCFFVTVFPLSVSDKRYMMALGLICFAYYKTYLFPQQGHTKKHVFLASAAVALAFFYVPISVLYLLLIFLAVLFHSPHDIRNYLIPFFAFATVAILYCAVQIVFFGNDFNTLLNIIDFSQFNTGKAGTIRSNTQVFYFVVCLLLMLRPACTYLRQAFGSSALIGKECYVDISYALITLALVCAFFKNEQNIVFMLPVFVTFFSKGALHSRKFMIKTAAFWLLPILAAVSLFFFK